MRRTIFNRDSTLQLIVQISSGNVNSSVRARAKTHGRTPISIELPRGRHLGSDACSFWAQMPASFRLKRPHLHCTKEQWAPDTYISHVQEHNPYMRAPRGYTHPCMHLPRDACI